MNKAVELMTAWGEFDSHHPDGSLDDFCRHYLSRKPDNIESKWNSSRWPHPVSIDFALVRLTGRIIKLFSFYSITAADGTGINTSDEFSLLNAIHGLKEPRKTEAIYTALFELSTGTDMLNRLIKIGYISEQDDPNDGRSKRVKLTAKGQKALSACRIRIEQLAEMLFFDLSKNDKLICIQLLTSVEAKFSSLWQSHKGKKFDEIYETLVNALKPGKS